MIWTRMVATALIAAAGVALVWLGLGLCRVTGGGNDVGHALIFLCALGAVVAGGWLCWQAAARHIMPRASPGAWSILRRRSYWRAWPLQRR